MNRWKQVFWGAFLLMLIINIGVEVYTRLPARIVPPSGTYAIAYSDSGITLRVYPVPCTGCGEPTFNLYSKTCNDCLHKEAGEWTFENMTELTTATSTTIPPTPAESLPGEKEEGK